jgi:hypothetical protein
LIWNENAVKDDNAVKETDDDEEEFSRSVVMNMMYKTIKL